MRHSIHLQTGNDVGGKLRWRGATEQFTAVAEKIGNPRLAERVTRLADQQSSS